MKTLLTIIAVIATINLSAQERNDNTIVVTTEYEYSEAYRRAGQALASNGLSIDHADRDFGTIATRSKDIGTMMDPGWNVRANILIIDNKVIIQGMVENNRGDQFDVIYGRRGSNYRKGWEQLHKVAEDIGGEITYEKR